MVEGIEVNRFGLILWYVVVMQVSCMILDG